MTPLYSPCKSNRMISEPCQQPDFKYFSKLYAFSLFEKQENQINLYGRLTLVNLTSPRLCSANRLLISVVQPIYFELSTLLRKIYTKYIIIYCVKNNIQYLVNARTTPLRQPLFAFGYEGARASRGTTSLQQTWSC